MTDYMQKTFDEAFDTVYANIIHRKENDPNFTKQSLKELLDSLYVNKVTTGWEEAKHRS